MKYLSRLVKSKSKILSSVSYSDRRVSYREWMLRLACPRDAVHGCAGVARLPVTVCCLLLAPAPPIIMTTRMRSFSISGDSTTLNDSHWHITGTDTYRRRDDAGKKFAVITPDRLWPQSIFKQWLDRDHVAPLSGTGERKRRERRVWRR